MNNKIVNTFILTVLFSSIIFCGGRVAFDVFANPSDTIPPELKSLIISPSIVAPGSYFTVNIEAIDISSTVVKVNAVFESPTGKFLHTESVGYSSIRNLVVVMPSGSEIGTWKVRSVYLEDDSGNAISLYYGKQINHTFTVGGDPTMIYSLNNLISCTSFTYGSWSSCQTNGFKNRPIISSAPYSCIGGNPELIQSCVYVDQCNKERPSLNEQSRYNCINSHGTWDLGNCVCTCLDGWEIKTVGTSCTVKVVTPGGATPPVSPNPTNNLRACNVENDYSVWGDCIDGFKKKSLKATDCTGESILTQACNLNIVTENADTTGTVNHCSSRESDNLANRQLCEANNKGAWNLDTCVCTCNEGYNFQGSTCVLSSNIGIKTCDSFTYGEWTACNSSGKQTRTFTRQPDLCIGTPPEMIERSCCTEDKWTCETEWSACSDDGKQKKACTLTSDCKDVSSQDPTIIGICKPNCKYTYTDWSVCDASGNQYRKANNTILVECTETVKEPLSRKCDFSIPSCQYTYTNWSSCLDGKKTRTVISKSSNSCSGTPVIEESCEVPVSQVSDECINIGWSNKSDCEIYTYREKIISDCKTNNLNTFDSCRDYIINNFGKPEKCKEIDGTACDNLINNVILSNFSDTISTETKEQLSIFVGNSGVINTQQRTITVQIEATSGEPARTEEVKVEEMPLSFSPSSSSDSGEISINLLSMSNTSSQESLSPVGIAFDDDGDGLLNDMEKRLGTDPNKKDTDGDGVDDNEELKNGTNPLDPSSKTTNVVLSGIDKAIINGKVLEQPKLANLATSDSLTVNSIENVQLNEKSNLKFQGKAKPNQIITLYIYSAMPIVVTVQADINGNWIYELDKTLVDGTHEVYVAINNDEGKIIEASLPTPFFIAEAQAISLDNFVSTKDASQISDKINGMMVLYVLGGLIVIFVLIAAILIIRQRYSE